MLRFLSVLLAFHCAVRGSVELRQQEVDVQKTQAKVSRARDYDEDFAYHSLMMSYAAWFPLSMLGVWNCSYCSQVPGFVMADVIPTVELLAYTGYDPTYNQVVAIFRGDANEKNLIANMDIIRTEYPGVEGAMIHMGFYKGWRDLQPRVTASMKKLMIKYPNSDLLIAGHSMGAALAQIAALDLIPMANAMAFVGSHKVHTTGSPRWANSELAVYYDSVVAVSWRLVNVLDMVPTIPFRDMGYMHTSRQVWYTSDDPLVYEVCGRGPGEDPNCYYEYYQSSWSYHGCYLNVKLIHPDNDPTND